MTDETNPFHIQNRTLRTSLRLLGLLVVLFAFLFSLELMGGAFKLFGKDAARQIVNVTSDPFVSLFLGMLATAIIQSSSTTTSMVVGLVGAGTLSIEGAVPLIMGANIGTSVTSSILAFGHIGKKKEYKNAVAVATVHDFFNIMVVAILFPFEYFFKFLTHLAEGAQELLFHWTDGSNAGTEASGEFGGLMGLIKPLAAKLVEHPDPEIPESGGLLAEFPWVALAIALLGLFFALRGLTNLLKSMVIGQAESTLQKTVFNRPLKALLWGTGITILVQSSSVTTSLMVPLVATNKVSVKKVFPFLMGANIGTTVTALIAGLVQNEESALTVALAHLLFNLIGVLVFFPIRFFRNIPLNMAKHLGEWSLRNRAIGVLYVVITFFVIPFLFFLLAKS